jgi:conjugative transfer pilus assembly protein TraH
VICGWKDLKPYTLVNSMRILILHFFLSMLALPFCLHADVKKEMLKFLDEIVVSSNASAPDIYKGQCAGYATGGGLTIRNKANNLNPATVTLPRFDAGCGGIDIYAGGFSFIDDEQLVQTLKSIGSASVGYAFLLALKTVSPQIEGTLSQLQSWANTINALNINSCEAAANLVGSVWPQSDLASEHICQTIGTNFGDFRDRVSTRHQCSSRADRVKKNNEFKEQNPDLDFDYNVVWNALQLQGIFLKDKKFTELAMTLMGTIIVRNEEVEVFSPKATDESFLRTLMDGGKYSIYTCDEHKKCLVIKEEAMDIKKSQAWAGRIEELLLSIQGKILTDEGLGDEEITLITRSRIPLYKYLSVLTAYKKGICPIEIRQMAEVIALDILSLCLREILESVRSSCFKLKQELPYADKIDDYIKNLDYVEKSLNNYELRSSRLMEQENSIFYKMDMLEKYIAQELHL